MNPRIISLIAVAAALSLGLWAQTMVLARLLPATKAIGQTISTLPVAGASASQLASTTNSGSSLLKSLPLVPPAPEAPSQPDEQTDSPGEPQDSRETHGRSSSSGLSAPLIRSSQHRKSLDRAPIPAGIRSGLR